MRLKESRTNDIFDMSMQYVDAVNSNDYARASSVKARIAVAALADGWEKNYVIELMNGLQSANTDREVYQLLAKRNKITEDAPFDKMRKYKAIIAIPVISKKNIKAEVKGLEVFLKSKRFKIGKAKASSTPSFETGEDGEDVVDVYVEMSFATKMERTEVFDTVEPKYEMSSLEEV